MNRGFTLIETLTYIALAVILLAAIINGTVLLSTSYRNIKTTQDIESTALFVMNQIIRQARLTQGATAEDKFLTLRTTKFYLSDGTVLEDTEGANSLVFKSIDTGNATGAKIELTIGGKHFYDTVLF